ncbi:unnamed protein product, partial [Symbiodinium sp. CCMP2456]
EGQFLPATGHAGGIALVLIYGAALVAAVANPLTKRRLEVRDQAGKRSGVEVIKAAARESVPECGSERRQ